MKRFEYYEARSVGEAISLLEKYGDRANLLAGGTDLFVEMRENIRNPEVLINLKTVPNLKTLEFSNEIGLTIGSLVTTRAIETSGFINQYYPNLHQAVKELGSIQVRNRATLVGNVCRASPSADTLPPLIADGAKIKLVGPTGEFQFPLQDFFVGPGKTVLKGDNVVIEINVPPPSNGTGKSYIKHGRRKAMELATVGVAVTLTLEQDVVRDICIVLGAVAPTPIRAHNAEKILKNQTINEELVQQASMAAMAESKPISNVRSSADYRRKMVAVLTKRAINIALKDAA